jgi:hypothetical protein
LILALSLALAPVFIEPLRLTTGLEVEAQYSVTEDGFCLALEDFVLVSRDLAGAVEAIDEERRTCDARVKRAESDCTAITSTAVEENRKLKRDLEEQGRLLDQARFSVKVWRTTSLGVLVLSSVAVMVIATR